MQAVSLHQFAKWMKSSSQLVGAAHSVAIDSRTVTPGALFFALPGERADGHDYLAEAAERGAVAAVVQKRILSAPLPILEVENTTMALQEAASGYLRAVSRAPIAAVTGSVGKTTVKGFAQTLLGQKYRVMASPGNQNSQVGLPLSLFEVTGEEEWLILEMALSGPHHIERLVEIAPPQVALITSVELTHAQFFDSIGDIALAKGEIFSGKGCRTAIMCGDIPRAEEVAKIGSCPKVTFSITCRTADYWFDLQSDDVAIWKGGKEVLRTAWTLPGHHNRYNFCCAALLAHMCGLGWEEIARGVGELALPGRRFERVEKRGVTLFNDTYNACERSVVSALDSLPQPKEGGKRIALLGSMGELGEFARGCHERVARHALDRVDLLLCYGEGCLPMAQIWQAAGREVAQAQDRGALLSLLRSQTQEGDVVLVKGANAHKLWTVVEEF